MSPQESNVSRVCLSYLVVSAGCLALALLRGLSLLAAGSSDTTALDIKHGSGAGQQQQLEGGGGGGSSSSSLQRRLMMLEDSYLGEKSSKVWSVDG